MVYGEEHGNYRDVINTRRLVRTGNGSRTQESRKIVEDILGYELPPEAIVRHIDGNPLNNSTSNLLVCQDTAYHRLIHQRQDAYKACGHADWRKCNFCKEYDDPKNLYIGKKAVWHRACMSKYQREWYQKRVHDS